MPGSVLSNFIKNCFVVIYHTLLGRNTTRLSTQKSSALNSNNSSSHQLQHQHQQHQYSHSKIPNLHSRDVSNNTTSAPVPSLNQASIHSSISTKPDNSLSILHKQQHDNTGLHNWTVSCSTKSSGRNARDHWRDRSVHRNTITGLEKTTGGDPVKISDSSSLPSTSNSVSSKSTDIAPFLNMRKHSSGMKRPPHVLSNWWTYDQHPPPGFSRNYSRHHHRGSFSEGLGIAGKSRDPTHLIGDKLLHLDNEPASMEQ